MLLSKNNLDKALEILAADANVFVPGEVNNVKKFVLWEKGQNIDLTCENVELPPKDILFPNTEKMYSYKMGVNVEIKETINNPVQVVFGIRPCDVRSIECMDKVFLEKGYIDTYYSGKRENLTIFSMGCVFAQDTCFCESMGLDPNNAPGADVMMNNSGDNLFLEAKTKKGEEALGKIKGLLIDGEKPETKTSCEYVVNMTKDLPEKLAKSFDNPIWDEVGKACIGCATCTYVCPTCYCFDIGSENHGAEGAKFRCWDSCMFSDYSRMAGGHNPRPTKKERVRNRYLHKLSYFNERYGMTLCVGCGRCVEKCPAHMDISDFINKAGEVL